MGLAALTWFGATASLPIPLGATVLLGLCGAAAVILRRPVVLFVVVVLMASGLAAQAQRGLEPPPPQLFTGDVTLLSDPVPVASGQRVEVRVGRRHVEAWARGAAAGALVDRLSGERVWVRGRLGPLPETRPWLTARHVSARLEIDAVSGWTEGHAVTRLANALRRSLVDGAAGLSTDTRALFAGFVLGDDRGRSVLVTDDFRGAGLTHLLAVSGQNVAFVLALLEPGLRRLSLRSRFVATLAALASFALLTRFEPSVLRATAMAAIATSAATWGRDASSLRILALAVTALVLLDPLLVGAVGFQLSVTASLGIILLAPTLRRLVPGPEVVRLPLAVAVAAQVGVAPVLLTVFGGLPVVSLPANLLAVPAAGPVTAWGLTAGLVAGWVPALADLLHVPTRLLVEWVAGVARVAVSVPLGQMGGSVFAAAAVAGGVAAWCRHGGRRVAARFAALALLVVMLVPAARLRWVEPPVHEAIAADADLWRSGDQALLVVGGRVREADLLERLREEGVTTLDVVVCRSDAGALHPVVADLRRRHPRLLVIAPARAGIAGANSPASGSGLALGDLTAWLTTTGERIEIEVTGPGGDVVGPV